MTPSIRAQLVAVLTHTVQDTFNMSQAGSSTHTMVQDTFKVSQAGSSTQHILHFIDDTSDTLKQYCRNPNITPS